MNKIIIKEYKENKYKIIPCNRNKTPKVNWKEDRENNCNRYRCERQRARNMEENNRG